MIGRNGLLVGDNGSSGMNGIEGSVTDADNCGIAATTGEVGSNAGEDDNDAGTDDNGDNGRGVGDGGTDDIGDVDKGEEEEE